MCPSCSSKPWSLGADHHDRLGLGVGRGKDARIRPLLRRRNRKRDTHSSRPSRTQPIRAATLAISRILSSGHSGREILKRGADGFSSATDGFRGAPDGLDSPTRNVRSSPFSASISSRKLRSFLTEAWTNQSRSFPLSQ